MNTVRIAHIADIHFCEKYRQVALECLGYARDAAASMDAQVAIWAGDIFDSSVTLGAKDLTNDMNTELLAWARRMEVVGVEGNHDIFGSLEHFNHLRGDCAIRFARYPEVHIAQGAQFLLLPFPRRAWIAQQAASLEDAAALTVDAMRTILAGMFASTIPDLPRILVYHNSVSGAKMDSGQVLLGKRHELCAADLDPICDYGALGDIHKPQLIGNKSRYPGSVYHGDYGETGPRKMLIIDVHHGGYEIVDEVILPSIEKVTVVYEATEIGPNTFVSLPDTIANVDVKIKVKITAEHWPSFDQAELMRLFMSLYAGQTPHELIIEPDRQQRVIVRQGTQELTAAKTLREEATVWTKVNAITISEGVLDKMDVLEIEGMGGEL